jgi:hypothetical protein
MSGGSREWAGWRKLETQHPLALVLDIPGVFSVEEWAEFRNKRLRFFSNGLARHVQTSNIRRDTIDQGGFEKPSVYLETQLYRKDGEDHGVFVAHGGVEEIWFGS